MLEVSLFNLLSPLVSGKAYPLMAKQGTAAPFIVFSNVSSVPDGSICGSTRDSDRLFQVDCYHQNHSDLCTLREATIAALHGSSLIEAVEGFATDYEQDTKLFRALISVRCWENAASV